MNAVNDGPSLCWDCEHQSVACPAHRVVEPTVGPVRIELDGRFHMVNNMVNNLVVDHLYPVVPVVPSTDYAIRAAPDLPYRREPRIGDYAQLWLDGRVLHPRAELREARPRAMAPCTCDDQHSERCPSRRGRER